MCKIKFIFRFTSTGSATTLTCQLYGIILGIEVPFPGGCPVVEACNDVSVGDCPIEAGEIFDYKMTMKIESFFPAVSIMEDPDKVSNIHTYTICISKFDFFRFRVQFWENGH